MNVRAVIAGSVFVAILAARGHALAQQTYDAPLLGVMASEGRRWGWGSDPASTIGGFGVFGGLRSYRTRVGVFEQNQWWVRGHGMASDFGGFLSYDWASLWLDPQLSSALFARLELGARLKWGESKLAFVPTGVIGGRAAGFEIGLVATPEIWLSDLPNDGNRLGANLQVRMSFEVFEIVRFAQHLKAANENETP